MHIARIARGSHMPGFVRYGHICAYTQNAPNSEYLDQENSMRLIMNMRLKVRCAQQRENTVVW